jgi:anthranilate synthase component 2
MKILIIDNYDSFTYNLVHLVNELGLQCEVWRNDQFKLEDIDAFSHIILSPGPGIPSEAGLLLPQPMHGIATPIKVTDTSEPLFAGLPDTFKVGRYHSWVVEKDLPAILEVTAIDEEDGSVMALRHKQYNVRGVQFHPESVLTEHGKEMMQNWLEA